MLSQQRPKRAIVVFGERSGKDEVIYDDEKTPPAESLNNKQLIFPLCLPDGQILEIPALEDGSINVTRICKAAGKRLQHWKESPVTQALLEHAASLTEFRLVNLVRVIRLGRTRATFAHPDIAIHIAQWCSPVFALQVSRWTRELLLKGRVELGKEASSHELDEALKRALVEQDEKLRELEAETVAQRNVLARRDAELKKIKQALARYRKRIEYHKFNQDGPCLYLISYGLKCSDDCPTKQLIKAGIAGTRQEANIDIRLQGHRNTFPLLRLEFLVFTPDAELLERMIKRRYGENLNPGNHEVFDALPLPELKEGVIRLLDSLTEGVGYRVEDTVEEYNAHVAENQVEHPIITNPGSICAPDASINADG